MTLCFLNVGYQVILIFIGLTIIFGIIWRRVLLRSIPNDVSRWLAITFFSLLSSAIIFTLIIVLILGSVDHATWHK